MWDTGYEGRVQDSGYEIWNTRCVQFEELCDLPEKNKTRISGLQLAVYFRNLFGRKQSDGYLCAPLKNMARSSKGQDTTLSRW